MTLRNKVQRSQSLSKVRINLLLNQIEVQYAIHLVSNHVIHDHLQLANGRLQHKLLHREILAEVLVEVRDDYGRV